MYFPCRPEASVDMLSEVLLKAVVMLSTRIHLAMLILSVLTCIKQLKLLIRMKLQNDVSGDFDVLQFQRHENRNSELMIQKTTLMKMQKHLVRREERFQKYERGKLMKQLTSLERNVNAFTHATSYMELKDCWKCPFQYRSSSKHLHISKGWYKWWFADIRSLTLGLLNR